MQPQDHVKSGEKILNEYHRNLFYIDFFGETKTENKHLNNIKLILHLNLAASYLKEADYPNTLKACQVALTFDPYNIKALYRSAKAKTLQKDASNIYIYI